MPRNKEPKISAEYCSTEAKLMALVDATLEELELFMQEKECLEEEILALQVANEALEDKIAELMGKKST